MALDDKTNPYWDSVFGVFNTFMNLMMISYFNLKKTYNFPANALKF